jgi:hypothetical protein
VSQLAKFIGMEHSILKRLAVTYIVSFNTWYLHVTYGKMLASELTIRPPDIKIADGIGHT